MDRSDVTSRIFSTLLSVSLLIDSRSSDLVWYFLPPIYIFILYIIFHISFLNSPHALENPCVADRHYSDVVILMSDDAIRQDGATFLCII